MVKRHLIFHGLDSTAWLVGCVAAVVAAVVLIVLLLRYERRLVPRKIGNTLLGRGRQHDSGRARTGFGFGHFILQFLSRKREGRR